MISCSTPGIGPVVGPVTQVDVKLSGKEAANHRAPRVHTAPGQRGIGLRELFLLPLFLLAFLRGKGASLELYRLL